MDKKQDSLTDVSTDRRGLLIKAGGASALATLGILATQVPVYAQSSSGSSGSCDLFSGIICRLKAGFDEIKCSLDKPQPSLDDVIAGLESGLSLLKEVILEFGKVISENPIQTIDLRQLDEVFRLWLDFLLELTAKPPTS